MENEKYKAQIKELMEQKDICYYDICKRGLGILKEAQQPALFQHFVEEIGEYFRGGYAENPKEINELLEKNHREYGRMWNEVVNLLFRRQMPKEVFYEELWKNIVASAILDDKEGQVYALYTICMSIAIPYYQPRNVMRMENEEFAEYREQLKELIKEAQCMLAFPFTQKTERAAAVLAVLQQCRDDKEKTVLLADIINYNSAIALFKQKQ